MDVSTQGVKRRLPQEVKQKLAKVARLSVLSICIFNHVYYMHLFITSFTSMSNRGNAKCLCVCVFMESVQGY